MPPVRTAAAVNYLIAHRLRNQLLSPQSRKEPHEIVSWLGAVQAQDYGGAKWALGLRGAGITDADAERSFNEGTILRTHVLRPTWHFVTPADIRWMLALSAPRIKAAMAYQLRASGLDQQALARGTRAIERALRDGHQLTRTELADVLPRAGLQPFEQRFTCVVMYAELDGVICSGARRGKQHTYALLEERVPPARAVCGDEALAELVTRYFRSHGPATAADFAWWSGMTVGGAKRGIQIVKQLVSDHIAERTHWSARTRAVAPRQPRGAYLLPNWDEYVVAYKDREMLARDELPRQPGARDVSFSNTIVVGGRLAGTWKRTLRDDVVVVEAARDQRWTAADTRAMRQAAKVYEIFTGRPASLVLL